MPYPVLMNIIVAVHAQGVRFGLQLSIKSPDSIKFSWTMDGDPVTLAFKPDAGVEIFYKGLYFNYSSASKGGLEGTETEWMSVILG